jgi:nucleotide-binding universal stress UspA family protein
MIKKILVPFDLSDYSLSAANEAIELASSTNGNATFIHIVEPEPYHEIMYDSPAADRAVEGEISEAASKWFSTIQDECEKRHIKSDMQVLFNRDSISKTIVSYAKDMGADIIVIGHSNEHHFSRWLSENVAKGVIDHAPCSVLVEIKKPG